jgi:uncharacterized protein (TIGR00725 family)
MGMNNPIIAVIGTGDCQEASEPYRQAMAVGRLIAERGCILVTGGLEGVMEAASRGAAQAGGVVVGVVMGDSTSDANPYVTVPIATGMGDARNAVIANTADGFIAVGGGYGTLSEIAFVLKRGKPIVHLGSWGLDGQVRQAQDPENAVKYVLGAIDR